MGWSCVGFSTSRGEEGAPRNSLYSCLNLQRLESSVRTAPVRTLERPTRTISSSTEPRPRACSATCVRPVEDVCKNSGRVCHSKHTSAEEIIGTLASVRARVRSSSIIVAIRSWASEAFSKCTVLPDSRTSGSRPCAPFRGLRRSWLISLANRSSLLSFRSSATVVSSSLSRWRSNFRFLCSRSVTS